MRFKMPLPHLAEAAGRSLRLGLATRATASGFSKRTEQTGADYLAGVEEVRRDIRRYESIPVSAVAICAIGLAEIMCFFALLTFTRPGERLVDAFPTSIVVQIATLIVLPLLAAVLAFRMGNWFVARIEARRNIACPHCRQAVPVHAPWECPHCFGQNTSTSLYAFVNRCRLCRCEPQGCYCSHCGTKIPLTREITRVGDVNFLCAKPIGWAPPAVIRNDALDERRPATAADYIGAAPLPRSPLRGDTRQILTEAFGLSESASVEEIRAAFQDSKDSDAKTYLAPEREAFERAAQASARQAGRSIPVALPHEPSEDAEANAARRRVAGHLGAGSSASWLELADYFEQADSDTKASMDAEDAQWLERMTAATRKISTVH
jgi:hypothetical protein